MEGVWKGLFEWSMQHHREGDAPRAMSEDDRKWLEEALKTAMIDLGRRMSDIKECLDAPVAGEGGAAAAGAAAAAAGTAAEGAPAEGEGVGSSGRSAATSLEDKERLLDELMEIVESIDHARDLHTIGGLPTLVSLLGCGYPSLRWRAAEVVATCVQNNPPVQRSFLEGGVMPPLEALLRDGHATVRTKALLAISCMVRGCPGALVTFRQQQGLASLVELLQRYEPRVQRKCLQILQYMLRSIPQDRPAACTAGVLPALAAMLGSEDNDLREAALTLAREIAKDADCLKEMQQAGELREQAQLLQMRLDALPQSEWSALSEEVEALKQLTAALELGSPPASPGAAAQEHRTASIASAAMSGSAPAALQLALAPVAAEAAASER